jgi:hypothetical protein
MTAPSTSLVLVVAAIFFVGGGQRGVTGMGLPTVVMAALGAPAEAICRLVVDEPMLE